MNRAPQELRTYFVTTVTAQRRRFFQVESNAKLLLDVLQSQREKQRMEIHAFVVMRDHVHLLLTPAKDVSLEKAMQFVKGGFSFLLKSKMEVWERSFNEAQVTSHEEYVACKTYIEQNPVVDSFVEDARDFRFGSASGLWGVDSVPEHLR